MDIEQSILPHEEMIDAFIEALIRAGVRDFVVCPGSRNTPLTVGLINANKNLHGDDDRLKLWRHIDERSAGYFALGIARATNRPVAVSVTSGSAVANLLPAAMEARISRVPLIFLTADRPAELQEVGANQTAKQVGIFGDHVKWDVQLPMADVSVLQKTIKFSRAAARRSVGVAMDSPNGPVHVNIPFREPLLSGATGNSTWSSRLESTLSNVPQIQPEDYQVELITDCLRNTERGIILCGPELTDLSSAGIFALSELLNWPIVADPMSNLRWGPHDFSNLITTADTLLRVSRFAEQMKPEVVLRFGAIPTSKVLNDWLTNSDADQIVIDQASPAYAGYRDESGSAEVYRCTPKLFIDAVKHKLSETNHITTDYLNDWRRNNIVIQQYSKQFSKDFGNGFEGSIFVTLSEELDTEIALILGNSMPVRDADSFISTNNSASRIYGTRGVSGIDGVVSAAAGTATIGAPTILVVGDLSFIHDTNGMWAAARYDLNLKIILINNSGGGIFSFLPQKSLLMSDDFEEWWGAPHDVKLEALVDAFGGKYKALEVDENMCEVLLQLLVEPGLAVLEIKTNRSENLTLHRQYWKGATDIVSLMVEE